MPVFFTRPWCTDLTHVMWTDRGFLLAEEMLSWPHNNNVIFPSVDVIERTLAEATTLADREVFSALTAQLENERVLLAINRGESIDVTLPWDPLLNGTTWILREGEAQLKIHQLSLPAISVSLWHNL